jgi:hypothetical protein
MAEFREANDAVIIPSNRLSCEYARFYGAAILSEFFTLKQGVCIKAAIIRIVKNILITVLITKVYKILPVLFVSL